MDAFLDAGGDFCLLLAGAAAGAAGGAATLEPGPGSERAPSGAWRPLGPSYQ